MPLHRMHSPCAFPLCPPGSLFLLSPIPAFPTTIILTLTQHEEFVGWEVRREFDGIF